MPASPLDVRALRGPDRHPAVFRAYDALDVGESLVLVTDQDPRPLGAEFAREFPGSHGWEDLAPGGEPGTRWVRIEKRTATALPRVLGEVTAATAGDDPGAGGVMWTLSPRRRDLDSTIVRLRPDTAVEAHTGPELDVLVVVLAGTGRMVTETDPVEIRSGDLVWLPRRSRRGFIAGPDGLGYLTVHQRRQALVLEPPPAATL